MSAAPAPAAHQTVLPGGSYDLRDALASEWTKLRTLRSTYWTLFVTVLLSIGLGALISWLRATHYQSGGLGDQLSFDPTRISLSGMLFAQLSFGVLGVLVVSAEYGSGTIRSTFQAIPKRLQVLAAKVILFGVITFVLAEVFSFVAFFVGQTLLSTRAPHATLSDPNVLRALLASGCYLTALGLLALGLATIIRHTAGAISSFVGILFVLPIISDALPSSLSTPIDKYLPANIGINALSTGIRIDALAPWAGIGVLCGYAAAVLAIAAYLLTRRDA